MVTELETAVQVSVPVAVQAGVPMTTPVKTGVVLVLHPVELDEL
jgi:methyl coenzyme M reductase subunit C